RASGAYVPLDPGYPRDRLAFMLRDSGARLVLTQRSLAAALPEGEAVLLDGPDSPFGRGPDANPGRPSDPDQLGYVIYTSGPTGQPRGVAMRREPLRPLIEWQVRASQVGPGGAPLQYSSLSFDVSFQEIFSTWAAGGALVLIAEADRRDPRALLRALGRHRVARL